MTIVRLGALVLIVATFASACAGSPSGTGPVGSSAPSSAGGAKRITAGILGNPYTLSYEINTAGTGSVRGVGEVEKIIHSGLVIRDGDGRLQPQLAEAVPTLENGKWRISPDGRMETTWVIRQGAVWHDGTPFTAGDLVFTLTEGQDKDLALPGYPGYKSIDGIDAADDRTVTVRWIQPFIDADTLFSSEFLMPRPKHLLEQAYLNDKASYLDLPYWTVDYVGLGPFKLREFVRDSHMVVDAFDQYVLGRPKLDTIEVRFIQDPNALIANVLAGEVQVTVGRGFNLDQIVQVAGQWPEGRMETSSSNWIAHYPQALTPNPPVLGEVAFRRALLMSLDRQAMSDSLQNGQAPVAHAWLEVGDPNYAQVEPFIVKYPFDPRQAASLIEGLGYAKGADGFYHDSSGKKLTIESRTNAGDDVKEKIVFSSADYWQHVGVGVDTVIVPRQQASDREYRATFPGLDLVRQPFEPERIVSSQAALPTNKFSGKNRTRYMNAELDGYVEKYLTTIPLAERIQALGQMMHLMTDQVVALGIFYAPEPKLISNRLPNVHAAHAPAADETWNVNQWELR
ncbi:MAG TPA: ABC transporter substrate-binding protein [Chloroflexota bacterium]|nr:ABC transporter substrate-binding protein [Chloroflexota bacterium]